VVALSEEDADAAKILRLTKELEEFTTSVKLKTIEKLHANAEVFDKRSEDICSYLQVFSACSDSFAHGANDVANAIGPYAAIVSIYTYGQV